MNIAIGCDELGLKMKIMLIDEIARLECIYRDFGTYDNKPVDYPDIAYKVACEIAAGRYDRGILICGTGIGMCIAANKVNGVYAAVCHDIYYTERSILSNNVNILCFGALVIGPAIAKTLIQKWLSLEFVPSASIRKIGKIKTIENGTYQCK
jgi:ribose 5-phosphate isomerase B